MKTNSPEKHASDIDCEEIKMEGVDVVEDDPIARGLVRRDIQGIIGEDISEPGYDEKETSEISEYVDKLADAQYQGSLDTLKIFNLYNPEQPQEGDVFAPTLEQAKEILASQVTSEQMEVIKKMEKPTLELIPVTSMKRYIKALDSYKSMDDQIDAYVSPWYRDAFERADRRDGVTGDTIIGWKIAVMEGVGKPKLLEGDDPSELLRERAAWFNQEFGREGVSGVDLKGILALMMGSLKSREPINDYGRGGDETWTFVNGGDEKGGVISGVGWDVDECRVDLFEYGAAFQDYDARFRVSVMVDVPKS